MKKTQNVLLLTLDDMNYNSKDFMKDRKETLTPNLDSFASDALLFTHSHVTIAVCQPSRSVLMTGRYPHHNGARGFECIDSSVPTLSTILHNNGWYTGIIGKEDHLEPKEAFSWDSYIRTYSNEEGWGRNPSVYYEKTKSFIDEAKKENKPFFLMANSHDPHRPFAGAVDEIDFFGKNLPYDKLYGPEDVTVPDFLPDLEDVRLELSQYLNSVHRGDQTVGEIIRALKESGAYEETVILILSDNGMALPFCKANCYLNSTKSPYLMKIPGMTEKRETDALVSAIDYMPTILDYLEIEKPEGMDGKSLLHLFNEGDDTQYSDIYTFFFKTAKNQVTHMERHFPMRAVVDKEYAYIYNSWSDGENKYIAESMAGLTYKAMEEAAETDPGIQERVNLYRYRVREELYSLKDDPGALHNLVSSKEKEVRHYRERLKTYMKETNDELLPTFLSQIGDDNE